MNCRLSNTQFLNSRVVNLRLVAEGMTSMSKDDVSHELKSLEDEILKSAASSPENTVTFDMESSSDSIATSIEIKEADYEKYLTKSQRSSLPMSLQDGIIRKKMSAEAAGQPVEDAFAEMREESDMEETDTVPMEVQPEGPSEEPQPEPTLEPVVEVVESSPASTDIDTDFAERYSAHADTMRVASMTQKEYERWLFPESNAAGYREGQIALARILANLKSAGYDSHTLNMPTELYAPCVQIAASLWSRKQFNNGDRASTLDAVEQAPASQIVDFLRATAQNFASVETMFAESVDPLPESQMPKIVIGVACAVAVLVPIMLIRSVRP